MKFASSLLAGLAAVQSIVAQPTWGTDETYRIHPGAHETVTTQAHLYAKYEANKYWFKIIPQAGKQVFESTLYFNLDQDQTTVGSPNNGPGGPAGYEMYAFITPAGANIYKGCAPYNGEACRTLLKAIPATGSAFTLFPDNSVEFSVAKATFGGEKDIEIAVVLQSRNGTEQAVSEIAPPFLLNYYSMYLDLDTYLATPCATKQVGEMRSAILFDDLAKDLFFLNKSYVQLAMSMQHQVRQSGMPQDMIRIPALLDIAESCKYTAIVIPSLTYVTPADWPKLKKAFFLLTQVYGVGVVTGGEFMSNGPDRSIVPGDPYFIMSTILGVTDANPVGAEVTTNNVKISSVGEIFWDRQNGETIMDTSFAGRFTSFFLPTPGSLYQTAVPAKQVVTFGNSAPVEMNAVILSEIDVNMFGRKNGRVAHFATAAILANKDLVWRALMWISTRDIPAQLSLLTSRFDGGVFTCRNDMDQSQYIEQAEILEPAQFDIAIKPWYDNFNFVASYYINVGNDEPNLQYTNWTMARETYSRYMDTENEMGSHSYTHPSNINFLTPSELEFEFLISMNEIAVELGLPRIAAAQPGNPEDLRTALLMESFMPNTYFSGGFSGVNAGYPGVFGFINPESTMVYVAPNMKFDFSLKILGQTPAQMQATWIEEFNALNDLARSQVYHWPIHDYAVTEWDEVNLILGGSNVYSTESMTNLIQHAYNNNVEFITTMQLNDRIRSHKQAKLITTLVSPNKIAATVTMPSVPTEYVTLGHHALKLEHPSAPKFITAVTGYYAYTKEHVIVPASGGRFEVTFGSLAQANANAMSVSRITSLGMRMELVSVAGDGKELTFTVRGKGDVTVMQNINMVKSSTLIAHTGSYTENWTNKANKRGLTFNFDTYGLHTVAIVLAVPPPSPSVQPTTLPPQTCATSCSNPQARFNYHGISIDSTCSLKALSAGSSLDLCDCDLSIDGAINPDGSLDLVIACPSITALSDQPMESASEEIFQQKSRAYQNACAQLCATDADCDYWTLITNDNVCYPFSCVADPNLYLGGDQYISGTPCTA